MAIARTIIYLTNPTGDATKDEQFKQQIADTFRIRAGGSFSTLFASQGINLVQQLPFVKSAEYRLYESVTPGRLTIAVIATLQPEETKPTEQPKRPPGILVNGEFQQFPTQSGGLSDWLQGLSLGKVFTNPNSFTHRVSLGLQPTESLSLSLNYYYRYADQLNNLGGSRPLQVLQSRYIGQAVQLLAQYFLSQHFLLQGLTSIAFPGTAIQKAVPNTTEAWFTFQISAYMFF